MTAIKYGYNRTDGSIGLTSLSRNIDPAHFFVSRNIKKWWSIKSPVSTPVSTTAASVLLPRATADLKRVPKKTLNVSKVSEQDIQEDTSIHEDTSLFKLTKTGSTRLYVGVCIVALIAIYTQSKIFKKIIK